MITPYSVFDLATGELVKAGNCQIEMLSAQAEVGQRAMATNAVNLAGVRQAVWDAVKVEREARYSAGITTPFGVLDTKPDSREKITGLFADAISRVATGGNKDRNFTKTDETQVTLSSVQLVAVGQLVVDYIDAVHQRSQALRAEIYNANTTMVDLLTMDIGVGWP